MSEIHLGDILTAALGFGLLIGAMLALGWLVGRLLSRDGDEDLKGGS